MERNLRQPIKSSQLPDSNLAYVAEMILLAEAHIRLMIEIRS